MCHHVSPACGHSILIVITQLRFERHISVPNLYVLRRVSLILVVLRRWINDDDPALVLIGHKNWMSVA